IALIAASFLAQFTAATGKRVTALSNDALGLLTDYDWPGNVRELRSAIEFAVIRCTGAVIQPDDLPPEILQTADFDSSIPGDPLTVEQALFLQGCGPSRARRALGAWRRGISRGTRHRRLGDREVSSEEK